MSKLAVSLAHIAAQDGLRLPGAALRHVHEVALIRFQDGSIGGPEVVAAALRAISPAVSVSIVIRLGEALEIQPRLHPAKPSRRAAGVRVDILIEPASVPIDEPWASLEGQLKAEMDKRLAEGAAECRFVVPLRGDTVDAVFPIWHGLRAAGLPYRFALGDAGPVGSLVRLKAVEFLDNLAHWKGSSAAERFTYQRLRDAALAGEASPGFGVRTLEGDAAAEEAVRLGALAAVLRRPTTGWLATDLARRLRLDKAVIVLRGLAPPLARRKHGLPHRSTSRTSGPRALVVGWYGTETVGDKAVLGELLSSVGQQAPGVTFDVASMLPFHTQRTLLELEEAHRCQVVSQDPALLARRMPAYDLVLIGGGPLMDLVELDDLVRIFRSAHEAGVPAVVAGCGVGPVNWSLTRRRLRSLARLADRIVLRDRESRAWFQREADAQEAAAGVDPGYAYIVDKFRVPPPTTGRSPVLGLGLRDWPRKYAAGLSRRSYETARQSLIQVWASVADTFAERYGGSIHALPMNTLHVGGDDRQLNAQVRSQVRNQNAFRCFEGSYSAREIGEVIAGCDVFLAMRYHSLIFSAALCVPVVAVDYTQGGKVRSFARSVLPEELLCDVLDLTPERVMRAVDYAMGHREDIRGRLLGGRDRLYQASRLAGATAGRLLVGRA